MSESNVFTLALNQFTETGKSVLVAAQQSPAAFGPLIAFGPIIAGGLATIIVPIAIGFGATGPVAGTLAAAWQASIGNVVTGSLFAMMQSLTMSGAFVKLGGVLIAVGAVGLARAGQLAKSMDWSRDAGELVERWARAMELVGREGVRSVEWIGKEMWKKTEAGVRIGDWEGVAQGAKRAGKETWKKAEEGIRNAVSKKVVQREGWIGKGAWMGKGAWKGTEKGVRSTNWEWVTQGAKRAGMETWKKAGEGIRNAVPKKVVQREGWMGKGAWKGTEKGAKSANWEWVVQGAKRAKKETWKKTEKGVRGAD